MPKFIGKLLLIGFVLWHMFSVAIYTVPRVAVDPVAKWIMAKPLPIVTPYMLMTSQWQLWNIFAPDPLRLVTYYRVEVKNAGTWYELQLLQNGTFSIWRHATRFKLYSNLLNQDDTGHRELKGRFLQLICEEEKVSPGTPIRLVYQNYVIPYHEKRESTSWWNAWQPEPYDKIGFISTCPERL